MATQDSRILIKRSTTTGVVPTVPSSNDHTDGTWIATDIYKGELFFNQADGIMFTRDDSGIVTIGGNSDSAIYSQSVSITSDEILQLNSTPKTLVSGVTGKIIVLVSSVFKATYNSATYDTNLNIVIKHNGSSTELTDNAVKLGFTADTINQFAAKADNAADQLISGANLQATVTGGNPMTGDSDITIDVRYYLLDA